MVSTGRKNVHIIVSTFKHDFIVKDPLKTGKTSSMVVMRRSKTSNEIIFSFSTRINNMFGVAPVTCVPPPQNYNQRQCSASLGMW